MEDRLDKSSWRVLLVEDDADDYVLTSEVLAEIPGGKLAVEWAKSFDEGLAALRANRHDVVLLDYRLGQKDGLQFLRKAVGNGCTVPIILLTGQGDRDLALSALEAGADDYLVKGELEALGLERSIRYAVQQRRHATELERRVKERTLELEQANKSLLENEAQIRALLAATEDARVSAEAAKNRAEAATRAKDDFLAALSHELRTPLNPARLLATAMIEDAGLPKNVRENVEIIARGIALQAQLIDDLLDITRITGGKLRLNQRSIDAHTALKHTHEILVPDILERKIDLTFELQATDSFVRADEVRLHQVLWNVMKNAIKFTHPGGRILIQTRNSAPGMLEITVSDNGIGIEPAMLGKVFDAFVQEEHGHRFGGLGLGLAISRQLVEMQGGQISVVSAGRGQGATFHIQFPLSHSTEGSQRNDQAPLPSPQARPRRILLVEDHDETRETLRKLLCHRGHRVHAVRSFAAAKTEATDGRFDLIISDLGLPDGDGHELMKAMRTRHGLAGIALSGYGTDDDIARSRASGFTAHLTKPVTIGELETAIAEAPPPTNDK